jgi:hypothetical protein
MYDRHAIWYFPSVPRVEASDDLGGEQPRTPRSNLLPEIQGYRIELQRLKVNSATETNHAQSKLTSNMICLWLPEFQPERGRSCALPMMDDNVIAARLPKLSPLALTRRFLQLHPASILIRRLNNYPKPYPTATLEPFE